MVELLVILLCFKQFACFVLEIPVWLSVYSQAAQNLDHKLRWEMFRLPELDCFNAMLTRIYKQELEEIVMRYEVYRFVAQLIYLTCLWLLYKWCV